MEDINFLKKQLDIAEEAILKAIRAPRLREQHDKESQKQAYKYWKDRGALPHEAARFRYISPKAVFKRNPHLGTSEERNNPPTSAQAYGLKPEVYHAAQERIGKKLGETPGPKQLK